MDARCSISVSSEGTFLVAQALVLIPTDLTGAQLYQPYETFWPIDNPFPEPLSDSPYEAIAWEFVVTRERAIPVAAATMAATCGDVDRCPGAVRSRTSSSSHRARATRRGEPARGRLSSER